MKDVLRELTKLKNETLSFTAENDDDLNNWLTTMKNNLSDLYQSDKEVLERISNIENRGATLSLYHVEGLPSTVDSRSKVVVLEVIENIDLLIKELPI